MLVAFREAIWEKVRADRNRGWVRTLELAYKQEENRGWELPKLYSVRASKRLPDIDVGETLHTNTTPLMRGFNYLHVQRYIFFCLKLRLSVIPVVIVTRN